MVEPIDVDLTPPDESLYESILASMPGAESAQYDVDGDGIRELLVCREAGNGFVRSIAGSVYTIRDGQVVELMRDKEIMAIASVADGGLGVVKKDGRLYRNSSIYGGHRPGPASRYDGSGPHPGAV